MFIDETTWASTNMARTHGRCRRGERLRMAVPHGHWKTTTLVAGLGARGVDPALAAQAIDRYRLHDVTAGTTGSAGGES